MGHFFFGQQLLDSVTYQALQLTSAVTLCVVITLKQWSEGSYYGDLRNSKAQIHGTLHYCREMVSKPGKIILQKILVILHI